MWKKINEFEMMIFGVLKKKGITPQHPEFEDYQQELRMYVFKQLLRDESIPAQGNPHLFQKLVWLVQDLQRQQWRIENTEMEQTMAIEEMAQAVKHNPYDQINFKLMILALEKRADNPLEKCILQDLRSLPDDTVENRCERLNIGRSTYYRHIHHLRGKLRRLLNVNQ